LYQFKVNLKWPNDVLINNRKISGILVESSSKGNKIEKAVIGIAVNVNQSGFAGQYTIQPTSVRKEFKKEVSREKLLSEILNCFEEIFEQSLINPEKVLNDWRSRCKLIGEKIKIEDEGKTIHGVFEDIDKNGYLLLRTPKELSTIHFGDISLRQ
ncbi:MAG: biotin--[acetyl-CoA-carboxylase] ligase, partial [Melioribacteraceae bacterium]